MNSCAARKERNMAKVEEVLQFMQQLAPPEKAASWDNVGVLVDCGADPDGLRMLLVLEESEDE